jgi:hypothetical protein
MEYPTPPEVHPDGAPAADAANAAGLTAATDVCPISRHPDLRGRDAAEWSRGSSEAKQHPK